MVKQTVILVAFDCLKCPTGANLPVVNSSRQLKQKLNSIKIRASDLRTLSLGKDTNITDDHLWSPLVILIYKYIYLHIKEEDGGEHNEHGPDIKYSGDRGH